MQYWLIKSEPETWSWEQQVAKGRKGEPWSGVRNHTAKQNLQKMKKGDRAFFYHSGAEKAVVGICEVSKEAYPDPTRDPGTPWVCCDFVAIGPFAKPVSMEDAKKVPALKDMSLLKFSRLSVQPVSAEEWKIFCKMGGVKP